METRKYVKPPKIQHIKISVMQLKQDLDKII